MLKTHLELRWVFQFDYDVLLTLVKDWINKMLEEAGI